MLLNFIKKLGFRDDRTLENYVNELSNNYAKEVSNQRTSIYNEPSKSADLSIVAKMIFREVEKEHDFRANKKVSLENQVEGANYKTIVDFLIKPKDYSYVTASDIANYIFCPVRYCISKTFTAEETNEAKKGTYLHAENRLVSYMTLDKEFIITTQFVNNNLRDKSNEKFFDEISSAKILYVGHDENSKKYFMSKKGKFVGQPDYVFKNSEGENFMVEEKFKPFGNKRSVLQSSHKAQIASYVMGLNEFNANHGYVVYWHYAYEREYKREYERKYFVIKRCDVFRVDKSAELQQEIRAVYKSIVSLNDGIIHDFNPNSLNATKCVRCAVRTFCGHKTGRLKTLSSPYDKEYYDLIA